MTSRTTSISTDNVRRAGEAMEAEVIRWLGRDLGTLHRDDIARAALEAVWPEPLLTAEEIQVAAAGLISFLAGRAPTHIADCDRCQLAQQTLTKLEGGIGV